MREGNNVLLVVAIVAVTLAMFNLVVTVNKLDDIERMTGFATDMGTANLTIEGSASVNFTTDNINWGNGFVNETEVSATLNTEGTMTGTGWDVVSSGLVLENTGNTNVTLNFTSSKDAADFIGGTGPSFQWRVSDVEADSCVTGSLISSYTDVTMTSQLACADMAWENTRDTLEIDLQLVVPQDAVAEAKGTVITATATAI